mmetsp:Transcript_11598/g.49994  ORF Transcript_11598/g.49994 Transcript_11598/m.49994 type:complete len:261 (-) Transcript_11598:42-824(-)
MATEVERHRPAHAETQGPPDRSIQVALHATAVPARRGAPGDAPAAASSSCVPRLRTTFFMTTPRGPVSVHEGPEVRGVEGDGVVGGGARALPPLSLDARGDVPRQVEHVVRPGVQGSDVSPAVPAAPRQAARASAFPRALHRARGVGRDDGGMVLTGGSFGPSLGRVTGQRRYPVHQPELRRGVQRAAQDVRVPRQHLDDAAHRERGVVGGFRERLSHDGLFAARGPRRALAHPCPAAKARVSAGGRPSARQASAEARQP